MGIQINQTVTYNGDPEQGTVKKISGNRAYVAWSDGLEAWVRIGSLTPVMPVMPARSAPAARRRCEECNTPIPGTSALDDIADGRMPGYCRNC